MEERGFAGPSAGRLLKLGAGIGALVAAIQAVEMLAGNPRTINPPSALVLLAAWCLAGGAAGAGAGWLGGRALLAFRRPADDGAVFLAALVSGHLFLPLGMGPLLAVLLVVNRSLRRRLFPLVSRLDAAIALGLVVAIGWVLLEFLPVPPPGVDDSELAGGTPLPGSVPVTISVHPQGDFPEVAAMHMPLRPLASQEPGLRAALWSGRAPARTRSGRTVPRHLPAGGGIAWIPPRPGVTRLARLFPPGTEEEPPFVTTGTLPVIVAAAGIPVLRTEPSDEDPRLFLRILDGPNAPERAWAEDVRRQGAWIDVTLAADGRSEIALSGLGISLQPAGEAELTLMDVVPTALHLLGLAIPRNCDGRVLVEHLDSAGPGLRKPRYRNLRGAPPSPQEESSS